ncbi:2OG-Fe(II) oxygenase family protein [Pseudomonas sp. PS01297]|uniref:2OG-Fe(II) oxygenase family protein n=1 Tax=Pseudomonas sp. PS01297 TaxID=2991433 RepID=UPI00249C7F8A|nr:2OG-Fe(II) oxygenase family protein [Pseudomonas sp. PS01297]
MKTHKINMQRAIIYQDSLLFKTPFSLRAAIEQGLFLLKIPETLNLEPGIKLCREFYLPATSSTRYRGFRPQTDIYFDREHFQTEHLLVDKTRWATRLPGAVVKMVLAMDALGQVILQSALRELGVAQALWATASGGAVTGLGTHWFAASHYRPERHLPGCAEHQDTGFVTLLYTRQSGLEAFIDGGWQPIEPEPGYFIVNFGACLELLSAQLPLSARAIKHRVRECAALPGQEDRFSFATFLNPPASADLYEVQPLGELRRLMSAEAFLRRFNERTWQDRHASFGILSEQTQGTPNE